MSRTAAVKSRTAAVKSRVAAVKSQSARQSHTYRAAAESPARLFFLNYEKVGRGRGINKLKASHRHLKSALLRQQLGDSLALEPALLMTGVDGDEQYPAGREQRHRRLDRWQSRAAPRSHLFVRAGQPSEIEHSRVERLVNELRNTVVRGADERIILGRSALAQQPRGAVYRRLLNVKGVDLARRSLSAVDGIAQILKSTATPPRRRCCERKYLCSVSRSVISYLRLCFPFCFAFSVFVCFRPYQPRRRTAGMPARHISAAAAAIVPRYYITRGKRIQDI